MVLITEDVLFYAITYVFVESKSLSKLLFT